MEKTYDFLFKLLLIGDSGVGKEGLIMRFAKEASNPDFVSTIGVDFKMRTVEIDNKTIKLQIWDTAGQERFKSITTAYYRGASGIMLVYDVSCRMSFEHVPDWIKNIEESAPADIVNMLIGNKCDVEEESREVTKEQGQMLADKHGMKFFETSVNSGLNVEEALLTLARDIKDKMDKPRAPAQGDNKVRLQEGEKAEEGGSCSRC